MMLANKVLQVALLAVVHSVNGKGLSACIGTYPGYEGNIDASDGNKVTVRFDDNDMVFRYHAKGVEADCTNCGVHIHSGTTCDDASLVGGHYWNSVGDTVPDPWTSAYGAVYNTDSEGMANAMYTLNSGYDYEENVGHAVVVHAQDGTRIGCGILSDKRKAARSCKPEKTIFQACINKYPDYDGDLNISGKVQLSFYHEDLNFRYRLRGADTDCEECGIHIHSGTTCDDAALVGGHYWDDNGGTVADPWSTAGGSIYTTDSDGFGVGKFSLNAGYDAEENNGHAVVIHDKEGTRYGCGILSTEQATGCTA